MATDKKLFTMQVTAEDRAAIAQLAEQEQRSAADAIRVLIRRTVQKNDDRRPQMRDGDSVSLP